MPATIVDEVMNSLAEGNHEGGTPWNHTASEALGWLSIVCWLIVGFPEFYEMYHHKSGAGISMVFLLLWGIGDILNIVGCILTNQLMTEIAVAVWYTIMDAVLIAMVIWYEYLFPYGGYGGVKPEDGESAALMGAQDPTSRKSIASIIADSVPRNHSMYEEKENAGDPDAARRRSSRSTGDVLMGRSNSTKALAVLFLVGTFALKTSLFSMTSQSEDGLYRTMDSVNQRVLMRHIDPDDPDFDQLCKGTDWECEFGAMLGWGSAVFYIMSRLPQLYKNYERKSCEGISVWMFFFSVMGNVTFSASLFIWSTRERFLSEKMPWIVGSLGTLFFDFSIFMQFFVYGDAKPQE